MANTLVLIIAMIYSVQVSMKQSLGMKRYLSEDYYFSRLWLECGGDIWADVAMPLTHFGNRAFKGHVGSLFAKKDDVK
jgi:hypothetical protein